MNDLLNNQITIEKLTKRADVKTSTHCDKKVEGFTIKDESLVWGRSNKVFTFVINFPDKNHLLLCLQKMSLSKDLKENRQSLGTIFSWLANLKFNHF